MSATFSEKMKFDKVMYEFAVSEGASTGVKVGQIQIGAKLSSTIVRYSIFGRDSQL